MMNVGNALLTKLKKKYIVVLGDHMDFKTLYEENKKNIIILVGVILLVIIFMLVFSGMKKGDDDNSKINNIIFTESNITIEENKTYQVKYEIYPSGLKDIKLTWTSSDEKIATVSEDGLISAIRPGTAVIVAKAKSGAVTSIIVEVSEESRENTSVKFNIENFDLKINTYRRLYTVFNPEDINYESITWESSDDRVATVSQTGRVNGVKTGKAIITATVKLKDGTYLSTSSNVNVIKETTLSLTNSKSTTLAEDTTAEIILALSDENVVVKQAIAEVSNNNIVQVIRRPRADNESATITSTIKGMGKGKAAVTYNVETTDGELITLTVNITVK